MLLPVVRLMGLVAARRRARLRQLSVAFAPSVDAAHASPLPGPADAAREEAPQGRKGRAFSLPPLSIAVESVRAAARGRASLNPSPLSRALPAVGTGRVRAQTPPRGDSVGLPRQRSEPHVRVGAARAQTPPRSVALPQQRSEPHVRAAGAERLAAQGNWRRATRSALKSASRQA